MLMALLRSGLAVGLNGFKGFPGMIRGRTGSGKVLGKIALLTVHLLWISKLTHYHSFGFLDITPSFRDA
jgi:hypothetical protein